MLSTKLLQPHTNDPYTPHYPLDMASLDDCLPKTSHSSQPQNSTFFLPSVEFLPALHQFSDQQVTLFVTPLSDFQQLDTPLLHLVVEKSTKKQHSSLLYLRFLSLCLA